MVSQATVSARKPRPVTQRLPRPTQKPRPTAAPGKAAYKPRIQFVSADAYALPSESYGGHILYLVTVLGPALASCECTGYTYRKTCKHCVLALAAHAYRAHPSHLQSAAALPEKESGLGVRVASTGEGYEVYSLRTGELICHVDDPARTGLSTTPTQGVDWKTLAAQVAALPVPIFDFRAQATPPPAFIPAPPAFAALFAA